MLAVQNEAAADARPDENTVGALGVARGAAPKLARHAQSHVVAHDNRTVPFAAQQFAQRRAGEGRIGRHDDRASFGIHDAGHAQSHAADVGAREFRVFERAVHRFVNLGEHGVFVIAVGFELAARENFAILVKRRRQNFGAADIDD